MKFLVQILALFCTALAAQGQVDFRAYVTSEDRLEGGRVEKLTVATSNLLFSIRPPRKWNRQVNEIAEKIIFTSPSGKSAITVQFTDSSPGRLPDTDWLKSQVLQAHPGAGFVQSGVVQTGSQPGVFFDLARMPAPGVVQRIRQAFVPDPVGEVEFTLASTDDEFPQRKETLFMMLRSFNVKPATPR